MYMQSQILSTDLNFSFFSFKMCHSQAPEIRTTGFTTSSNILSKTCNYRPYQPLLTITFPKQGMQNMQLLASICQTGRATTTRTLVYQTRPASMAAT